MSELKQKAIRAAERFLERCGYEVLDTEWVSEDGGAVDIAALDDGTVVICDVKASVDVTKGMPSDATEASRERMEVSATRWLDANRDNPELVNVPVRFDTISMLVIGEDRAFLRHHINCFGEAVSFANHRFEAGAIRDRFMSYVFTNGRPVTKSMLTWWAFNNDAQPLLDADARLEIEHIYSKKRADAEGALKDRANLESLGNKSLLEKRINIRASDYRFEDKKKYYLGYVDGRKQEKEGTRIKELADMAGNSDDFTEADIVERKREIVDSFVDFLGANGLLA